VSTRAAARAAAPAPARARPGTRPADRRARPRPVRAARRRGRLRLGRLAIPLVALILGGIVWINVAKLTLTHETRQVIERARSVEAETARLKSRFEQRNATVIARAEKRLGMVSPPSSDVTYLDAARLGAGAP
jgi:hypothetical protein